MTFKVPDTTAPGTAASKTAASIRLRTPHLRMLAAAACCAMACLIGAAGCTGGGAEIEVVVTEFVESIKSQDPARLEPIINWERYYSYREEKQSVSQEVSPEGVETQKALLLRVLAADRGLSLRYRTAENTIRNVSIDGDEASAEVFQVDRASGEERLITFLLAKNGVWKIYRFSTEELNGS